MLSVFAFLFLALLLLAGRARAIPASHLRMLPSHLSVTRSHLGITRHLIHRMRSVSGPSNSGSFASVHFGLVSPSASHVAVALISGVELVPICSSITCSCSLKITFGYVSGFVSTFSGFCSVSESFSALTLPRGCALTIEFGCVADFVFTFACTRSSCCPKSLRALALAGAFALVE